MTNEQISRNLKELALLMELNSHNSFKTSAIYKAASIVEQYPKEMSSLPIEIINQIKGIGKSISQKITELINTNCLKEKEELVQNTPPGLFALLQLNGLGIKSIIKLWKEYNVTDIKSLITLLSSEQVGKAPFTLKKTEQILKEIEFYQSNTSQMLYPDALAIAKALLKAIASTFTDAKVIISGQLRRKCDIINNIILVSTPIDLVKLTHLIDTQFIITNTTSYHNASNTRLSFNINNLQCCIYIINEESTITKEAFIHTGSKKFVDYVLNNLPAQENINLISKEYEIFEKANVPYIPPSIREDLYFKTIKNFPQSIDICQIVSKGDIKGLLHNHSNYSDGKNSIEEMALACKNMGYEYFGLCDHSKSAFYASGLSEESIALQHKEIDILNKAIYPFRILKGIEVDILQDGSLDYSDEILKSFDFIVASIHSGLNMDKQTATERIIKAINNKYVTILAHPTSRLLLQRKGYDIHYDKVFEACVKNDVAIELNANPKRLDLDWSLIYEASQMGIFISINPDAHSVNGLQNIKYGLNMAEKGILYKNKCLNALDLNSLLAKFNKNFNK